MKRPDFRAKKGFPLIMGILNITPDSFYEKSRITNGRAAAGKAGEMIESGADIIDIGGESTKPGSPGVDTQTELARVIPAIREIRDAYPEALISIDTVKEEVAEAALFEGASIINDISGLKKGPGKAAIAVKYGAALILGHIQGTPANMQDSPEYENPVSEIKEFLERAAEKGLSAGLKKEEIIIDPGIGFGKSFEHNTAILRGIGSFNKTGYPVLIGLSRKSYFKTLLGNTPEERLAGTISADIFAAEKGADILRVHDVKEAVDSLKTYLFLTERHGAL
ncbi:MAG: dihydropteroate synthase [Fibrobacterota bacterium]